MYTLFNRVVSMGPGRSITYTLFNRVVSMGPGDHVYTV